MICPTFVGGEAALSSQVYDIFAKFTAFQVWIGNQFYFSVGTCEEKNISEDHIKLWNRRDLIRYRIHYMSDPPPQKKKNIEKA
jgi:hypothetical protein